MLRRLFVAAAILAASGAASSAAYAQAQPLSFSGNGWVALGIIAGLVLLIGFLITGVLGVSSRSTTADDDGTGLPLFDTEDEDERPRKKRR